MERLHLFAACMHIACAGLLLSTTAFAASVNPGDGVTFSQVDLTHAGASQSDSATGQMFVDFGALTTATSQSSGFVNVYDSGGNWLIQNLPVDSAAPLPGLSVMFDLGVGNGTPLSSMDLDVQYDLMPTDAALPTFGTSTFTLGDVSNNAQGFAGGTNPVRTGAPLTGPGILTGAFDALGTTLIEFFTGHSGSIEQDVNQCAPAAIANSLHFLTNTTDLTLNLPHVPGDINSAADTSIVGELDKDMGRNPGQTVNGTQILNGKLQFESDEGIGMQLQTKHQGLLGGANVNNAGQTSIANGTTVTTAWILSELQAGEDVELGLFWDSGGGHFIEVIGGGSILGVPWIAFSHDADQGNVGGTGLLSGGYGFSFLRDTDNDGMLNFHNYIDGSSGEIVFAISESYIPTPAALPAGLALLMIVTMRRHRNAAIRH